MDKAGQVLLVLGFASACAFSAPGKSKKTFDPTHPPAFTDSDVQQAIRAGADYLLTHQNTKSGDANEGSWIPPGAKSKAAPAGSADSNETASEGSDAWDKFKVGETALIVYALLESGVNPQDKRLAKALDWLLARQRQAEEQRKRYMRIFDRIERISFQSDDYKKLQDIGEEAFETTYSVSLRAIALAAAVRRLSNDAYRQAMEQDVRRLIQSTNEGSYGYTLMPRSVLAGLAQKRNSSVPLDRRPEMWRDHSNAQYGVLGVWAGQLAGVAIPQGYWKMVQRHWRSAQNADGGWGYTCPPTRPMRTRSYPSMTAAGVATLFLCHDNLNAREFLDNRSPKTFDRPLQAALEWLGGRFASSMNPARNLRPEGESRNSPVYRLNHYYLFGVERIALAGGHRRFGGVDWYQAGAGYLLRTQRRHGRSRGSWRGQWSDGWRLGGTAYAVLFLARGQKPVLFSKLDLPDIGNRPRDLANLTRWVSGCYETDVNWQIVDFDTPVEDWHDAPILYLSGSREPTFTDEQIAVLRAFVEQGGTILSCVENGGRGFREGIRRMYAKLLPERKLEAVAWEHPLYTLHYKLPRKVKFERITNGVRTLVFHTDDDLSRVWQADEPNVRPDAFQLAVNLFLYVTDKGHLRHRGVRSWPAEAAASGSHITATRVRYDGNWNPEPLALEALRRRLAKETSVALELLPPVDAAKLPQSAAGAAFLTGTDPLTLSDAQRRGLTQFVKAGGVLIVDGAGGSKAFYDSAQRELAEILPAGKLHLVPRDHNIYTLDGWKIEKVRYRPAAAQRQLENTLRLEAIFLGDRPVVFLSREDLTTGLLGAEAYRLDGYSPADAYRIVRNILLETQKYSPTPRCGAGRTRRKPR